MAGIGAGMWTVFGKEGMNDVIGNFDTKKVLFFDVGGENYCITFSKMRI